VLAAALTLGATFELALHLRVFFAEAVGSLTQIIELADLVRIAL
jgi:hypothetical protein